MGPRHFTDWAYGFCNWGPFDHGFMGWLFPLLFWSLIIYLIVSLTRKSASTNRQTEYDAAGDILRKRFAAGEINEQQFLEMKETLAAK